MSVILVIISFVLFFGLILLERVTPLTRHQPAMSNGEAIEELKKNAGTQFDPTVVKAFLKVLEGHGKRHNKYA